MKRAIINNWVLFFSILILILLHFLTLFSIIPTEVLWDINLFSSQELIIAETIVIVFLITMDYFMRNSLVSFKKVKSRVILKRVLITMMIFSILEILGASIGMSTEYKFINISIYLYFLLYSIYCYNLVDRIKRHRKLTALNINKAQI